MKNKELLKAIELAGSQAELGRLIGKSQSHIYNWLNRDKMIPALAAKQIESALGGKVKKENLCPEVFR